MFRIGLDFDNTITYFPRFLSWLSKQKDIEVHVITAKREIHRQEIIYMLDKLEIKYKSLNCYPYEDKPTIEQKIAHKQDMCDYLNIDIMIDDDASICDGLKICGVVLQRK